MLDSISIIDLMKPNCIRSNLSICSVKDLLSHKPDSKIQMTWRIRSRPEPIRDRSTIQVQLLSRVIPALQGEQFLYLQQEEKEEPTNPPPAQPSRSRTQEWLVPCRGWESFVPQLAVKRTRKICLPERPYKLAASKNNQKPPSPKS